MAADDPLSSRFRSPLKESTTNVPGASRHLSILEPPATREEVRAASLQFVRKLSGFSKPSKANEEAFDAAVEGVAEAAEQLLAALVTTAAPKDREMESERRKMRAAKRFALRSI